MNNEVVKGKEKKSGQSGQKKVEMKCPIMMEILSSHLISFPLQLNHMMIVTITQRMKLIHVQYDIPQQIEFNGQIQ